MKRGTTGRPMRGLGVYAVGQEVYVTEIEAGNEGYQIRRAVQKTYLDPTDAASALTQLAESVHAICLRYDLTQHHIGITYPKEVCFWYTKPFPKLAERELRAAVEWDLELNCPYPEGRFWGGYCIEPTGIVKVAAVDEAHGRGLAAQFKTLGMNLSALTLLPEALSFAVDQHAVILEQERFSLLPSAMGIRWDEGQIASLYAALTALRPAPDTVQFLSLYGRNARLDWMKLGQGLFGFWLTALLFLYGFNGWRIHRLAERLEEADLAWEAKGALWEKMEQWRTGQEENAQRDSVLVQLSRERPSWSYVFYTLGTLYVPDVYLTGFEMKEDQTLYCQGRAARYENLLEFLDLLEDNRAFFRESPRLEHFETGESQGITFSLRLTF
ncbi:MAG: PilN domain-containing protein [Schwartzia sp. (in: firmicutes)]